jgi:hypothetical protein
LTEQMPRFGVGQLHDHLIDLHSVAFSPSSTSRQMASERMASLGWPRVR